ncbi:AraC family transcriptional regulator [Maribacter sp. HTCC2170]|uniref:AraC family transcriptional regulator n=1 Tax=Maribacter sp. (strain HTCC2170 / KCCM 42371) TaxID=313603 RepID=UPI00006BD227|nr:AraC family transcriptional regulator [Maribacter sp. HTCC2170]EAR03002.1 transcriptional regulator [Maribacter sp. HTCC2170]
MKIQLETFKADSKSPFRVLHNPRLNNLFYWHFHPEFELVYIEGASATRHVGNHISRFEESDLVLIGSNIPHLNFDYGVQTDYKKEVLHIKPFYRNEVIGDIPELKSIQNLFQRSRHGIAFSGETKKRIGSELKKLHALSPYQLFIAVLEILKTLSESEEYELLHDQPFKNKYNKKEQVRLRNIYAFIDENYQRKIDIEEVATICNLGKEAFCRYFKKATGGTFIGFLNQYRISQAKRLLLTGKNVGETCFECGFESLSYFNRTFKKVVNENPSDFRKRH